MGLGKGDVRHSCRRFFPFLVLSFFLSPALSLSLSLQGHVVLLQESSIFYWSYDCSQAWSLAMGRLLSWVCTPLPDPRQWEAISCLRFWLSQ